MSESLQFNPEHLDPSHEIEAHARPEKQNGPETVVESLGHKAEQARTVVEQAAESSRVEQARIERLEQSEAAPEPTHPGLISRELKSVTLQRELQSIRRRLPVPERVLSRVIHQPAVRIVSEAAGKTVSRPSGLLGGGVIALLGTTGYLYMARHMGFRYNYFVFLVLFGGGFIVGLILELIIWTVTRSRHTTN